MGRRAARGIPKRISRLDQWVLKMAPMVNGCHVSFNWNWSIWKLERWGPGVFSVPVYKLLLHSLSRFQMWTFHFEINTTISIGFWNGLQFGRGKPRLAVQQRQYVIARRLQPDSKYMVLYDSMYEYHDVLVYTSMYEYVRVYTSMYQYDQGLQIFMICTYLFFTFGSKIQCHGAVLRRYISAFINKRK